MLSGTQNDCGSRCHHSRVFFLSLPLSLPGLPPSLLLFFSSLSSRVRVCVSCLFCYIIVLNFLILQNRKIYGTFLILVEPIQLRFSPAHTRTHTASFISLNFQTTSLAEFSFALAKFPEKIFPLI